MSPLTGLRGLVAPLPWVPFSHPGLAEVAPAALHQSSICNGLLALPPIPKEHPVRLGSPSCFARFVCWQELQHRAAILAFSLATIHGRSLPAFHFFRPCGPISQPLNPCQVPARLE